MVEFGGYQFDTAGNPTFVLTVDGQEVEDSYEVVDANLKRVVTGEWPGVTHPVGVEVESSATGDEQTFIYSWK